MASDNDEDDRLDTALDEVRGFVRDRAEVHAKEVAALKEVVSRLRVALFTLEGMVQTCSDNVTAQKIQRLLSKVLNESKG